MLSYLSNNDITRPFPPLQPHLRFFREQFQDADMSDAGMSRTQVICDKYVTESHTKCCACRRGAIASDWERIKEHFVKEMTRELILKG